MSEHFFAFSDSFHKCSSSTQQSAITNKSATCSLIFARIRFYVIMLSRCLRMKLIIWIELDIEISIRTLKLKVGSYYLKNERLAIWIKSQRLRRQKTIFLGRLTPWIIKTNRLSIRKITRRVILTLALIQIRPWSAPAADRMVTVQWNALKNPRGRAEKVIQRIQLVVKTSI